MLIVALVLAVIGLAALVTAVVTSNAVVAWVCIGASVIGVVLLIVDAIRERQAGAAEAELAVPDEVESDPGEAIDATYQNFDAEYPDEEPATQVIAENPEQIEAAEGEPSAPAEEDTAEEEPEEAEPDESETVAPEDVVAPEETVEQPRPATN